MAKATFQPKWWTEKHGTQWANLKEALQRDWEQTKNDLALGGADLHQGLEDTLQQAAGAAPIPPRNALVWADAEQFLMFGVGAREQFGQEYVSWNDTLDSKLREEWESDGRDAVGRKWDDVKNVVRHAYNRARH